MTLLYYYKPIYRPRAIEKHYPTEAVRKPKKKRRLLEVTEQGRDKVTVEINPASELPRFDPRYLLEALDKIQANFDALKTAIQAEWMAVAEKARKTKNQIISLLLFGDDD